MQRSWQHRRCDGKKTGRYGSHIHAVISNWVNSNNSSQLAPRIFESLSRIIHFCATMIRWFFPWEFHPHLIHCMLKLKVERNTLIHNAENIKPLFVLIIMRGQNIVECFCSFWNKSIVYMCCIQADFCHSYYIRVGPKKVNLIVATCWSRPMWEMVIECLLDSFWPNPPKDLRSLRLPLPGGGC